MSRAEAVGMVWGALHAMGCAPGYDVLRQVRELVTSEAAALVTVEAIRRADPGTEIETALHVLRARQSPKTLGPLLAMSVDAARRERAR